jgi:phospholipase D3/4
MWRKVKGTLMPATAPVPNAYLVESIPTGLEDLRGTPAVRYTEDVLVNLTTRAQSTIDLTAMYWALIPDPTSDDERGFTEEQFKQLGANSGQALFQALWDAAQRGVRIRILQSPGFSGQKQESETLRVEFPEQVTIHSISMGDWYGGSGIMHQKIWIFDSESLYLGSANMDWKSISQVKEMGIAVENCPRLCEDAKSYFEAWWDFSALTPSSAEVFDPIVRIDRRVPPWSQLVPKSERQDPPMFQAKCSTTYNSQNPLAMNLGEEGGDAFLTGSPQEILGSGRAWDGDGLIYTIDDARRSVSVSVMDFSPTALFSRRNPGPPVGGEGAIPNDTPVWWPRLIDALLAAVLTRKIYIRLLVSKWAHTSSLIEPTLRALQTMADAGRADTLMSTGQLEIKLFMIPGWDSTIGAKRRFPGHTRVNHTKYIVTDRRINIGTSNMTWDYFASTAGSSLNANHPTLVRSLQDVFDRDWASSYAKRLV